jgi:hypothetical protein
VEATKNTVRGVIRDAKHAGCFRRGPALSFFFGYRLPIVLSMLVAVYSCVLGLRHDFEVTESVVVGVSVLVMHYLVTGKSPSNLLFHDNAVYPCGPSVHRNLDVCVRVRPVKYMAALWAACVTSLFSVSAFVLGKLPLALFAAVVAGEPDTSSPKRLRFYGVCHE